MRVFQPTYRDRTGAIRRAAKWYCELRNAAGVLRRVPAFADRAASESLGRQLVRLVNVRAGGDRPDPALTRWLEGLPGRLQTLLARQGFLDGRQSAGMRPLAEHVVDWAADLTARGDTARHVALVTSRARKVVEGCGFTYWSDISASKVMSYLADLRKDRVDEKGNSKRGLSAQTFNFYLAAVKGFCRWAVRDGRAGESPLVHLVGLNVRTDRRHDRRALEVEEIRRMLAAARKAPDRYGMTGAARAALYRLAVETGLRRGELASLTRASFNLDGPEPTVTVEASYSKHRRRDELPLRPDTAAELQPFLAGKLSAAPAFNVPARGLSASMLRADLDAAREAWLKEAPTPQERAERRQSTFLAYRDSAGRVADFHALRHTAGTLLAASGVHPKVAQVLLRHSDINLTMNRYTHTVIGQESAAVAALPDLGAPPSEAVAATGTDGATAPPAPAGKNCLALCLALRGGKERTSANSGGRPNRNMAISEIAQNPKKLVSFGPKRPTMKVRGEVPERLNGPVSKTGKTSAQVPVNTSTYSNSPKALGALLGAPGGRIDPDLAAVASAWAGLPDALRAGIMAMIKAAAPKAPCEALDGPPGRTKETIRAAGPPCRP